MTVVCRGIRGATTIEHDTPEEILAATAELLQLIVEANQLQADDIASVIFTTTIDIVSEYPALAARKMGWVDTALLCGHEMAVPHGLKKCIRVLINWNTAKSAKDVQHIYIKGAKDLRPDLATLQRLANQNGKDEII